VGFRPLVCFANPDTTQQFPVLNIRRLMGKDNRRGWRGGGDILEHCSPNIDVSVIIEVSVWPPRDTKIPTLSAKDADEDGAPGTAFENREGVRRH
jgi:hypothetical protein